MSGLGCERWGGKGTRLGTRRVPPGYGTAREATPCPAPREAPRSCGHSGASWAGPSAGPSCACELAGTVRAPRRRRSTARPVLARSRSRPGPCGYPAGSAGARGEPVAARAIERRHGLARPGRAPAQSVLRGRARRKGPRDCPLRLSAAAAPLVPCRRDLHPCGYPCCVRRRSMNESIASATPAILWRTASSAHVIQSR